MLMLWMFYVELGDDRVVYDEDFVDDYSLASCCCVG